MTCPAGQRRNAEGALRQAGPHLESNKFDLSFGISTAVKPFVFLIKPFSNFIFGPLIKGLPFKDQIGLSALADEAHHQRPFILDRLRVVGFLQNSGTFFFQFGKKGLNLFKVCLLQADPVAA